MHWTIEYVLDNWGDLFSPKYHHLAALNPSAKKLVASYLVAAFELRVLVGRCKAWRLKNSQQIDKEFMNTVILPLVRLNPRIMGKDTLDDWNLDYQDPRGRKPSSPKDDERVLLSLLRQRKSRYITELKIIEDLSKDDPETYDGVPDLLIDLIKSTSLISAEIISDLRQKKALVLYPLYNIREAILHLTSIGIPCGKIEQDVYWIQLLATTWGVESNIIYSASRKIKKISDSEKAYLELMMRHRKFK